MPDALGSTVALGDGTGVLQTQYTYEPFGFTTQTGAASTNSYKFTGREDDGSGLMYYRARYYQPRFQRFVSEDPIGFAGGDLNVYAYVAANPITWRDPLGHFALALPLVPPLIDAGIAVGGILAGGVVGQIISNVINSDDTVTYPDNPDRAPEKFERLPKSKAKQCTDDGSVWEPDTSKHGGKQWK